MRPPRPHALQVSWVRFTPASPGDEARGLLGFVRFHLGGIEVDGTTVRRTRDGRLALSFPARRDSAGFDHPYLRPLDDRTRRSIERQVFAALGLKEART